MIINKRDTLEDLLASLESSGMGDSSTWWGTMRRWLELVELLRDGVGEFLKIRIHGELSETMVFGRKAVEDATASLMSEQGILRRGSEELIKVWGDKPAPLR
jgi:hypothetical protein